MAVFRHMTCIWIVRSTWLKSSTDSSLPPFLPSKQIASSAPQTPQTPYSILHTLHRPPAPQLIRPDHIRCSRSPFPARMPPSAFPTSWFMPCKAERRGGLGSTSEDGHAASGVHLGCITGRRTASRADDNVAREVVRATALVETPATFLGGAMALGLAKA